MVTYQSTPDFYNNYISHHGILGQKWGKKNGPPYMFGDPDIGVSEKTIKDAYIDYKKNEKKIKKLAFEAIDNDNIYDNFNFSITDMNKGSIKPLTKQEFKNALDVKSIYVTPNNGVEVSIWEKDDDTNILAGHSLDIEFDLKDPKKPKYVSVNG